MHVDGYPIVDQTRVWAPPSPHLSCKKTTIARRRKAKPQNRAGGKKAFRRNEEIRVPEVRLIGDDGTQFGVVSTDDALQRAQAAGLDLVEVSPQADPPVAKIVDFGKLQYENDKQLRKTRAQSKRTVETKGIRLSVKIGEHDMMVRVKAGNKFLEKGDKLKIEIILRGREKAHPELAKEVIEKYIELLDFETVVQQPVKRMGGRFSSVVAPKGKKQ